MLLLLVTAQRKQTLMLLDTRNMILKHSSCTFVLSGLVKTARPTDPKRSLVIKSYAPDRRLCVMYAMREYVRRTKKLRLLGKTQLLISYQKPHNSITSQTLSRWIRTVMERSGIDTRVYKPHSTRSAATSKAIGLKVPIEEVLKKGGWSNSLTFAKYYKKDIHNEDAFQDAVLQLTD